ARQPICVASVGPLEGATLGAAVGGVGLAIQGVKAIDPKFFLIIQLKSSQKIADNIGKSVNEVKNSVSKYIGGFGKVIGFG
ncbi:hypothetical protein MXZ84_11100, partial [Streptococcus uberis]|nr:hypothetical protein [Streptococcus uberis]